MEIIDNINKIFGDDLKASLSADAKLNISASFFSIYAFSALKKELEQIDELKFIFTSPTFVANNVTDKLKKEEREFIIPREKREKGLYGTEFEIHLRNQLTQKAIAKECADWIRQKAIFKSNNTNSPMQEFACIKTGNDNFSTAYMPIQGFTPTGLGYEQGNAVSNFINKFQAPQSQMYIDLFNQVWHDSSKVEDITDELVRHIESVYQENAPERVYFLFLYNIFKEFLDDLNEDVMPNDKTGYQDTLIWQKLYNFQHDASVGIINKLETYNGCILADSVGLGKTFTALAVIKYYELRNKSVLVLCPKKLSDNWTNYYANLVTNLFAKDRFNYDVLYHTDLTRESGFTLGIDLAKINWGNYDLVVIDESHNFRNRDYFKDKKTRYDLLMEKVMQTGVKTKVLMLSATPVNNRFNDLKNQLALAYEGNTELLDDKLNTDKDLTTVFKNAQKSFNTWAKMPAETRTTKAILNLLDFDFFKLLDSVTIARSRRHIQTFYDTRDIGKFPTRRKPLSYRCAISEDNSITLDEVYTALSSIKMSVYAPISYILPSQLEKYEDLYDTETTGGGTLKQSDREKSLQKLMTINLLKRLESSVHAFRLTLQVLEKNIKTVIDKIEAFEAKNNTENTQEDSFAEGYDDYIAEMTDDLTDDDGNALNEDDWIGNKLKINLEDMDRLLWKHELTMDYRTVQGLLQKLKPITPQKDHKLQHLITHISEKIHNPINKGNKKVIIFTAFADTADYLYDNISANALATHGIHTAKITGTVNTSTIGAMVGSRKSYDMQGLLTLFSPQSKQKAEIFPNEEREIDILIATDCISEGQNLQDCDYLINYDIHWNPVRIIQRFGRVDRIGSPNEQIQLVNYWPDISLDAYINLKERVENRMIIVDVAGTGDDNVLTAKSNDVEYRRKQLEQLQDEVIDIEDANTGVSITDLGLNDFRMDLLSYLEDHPDLAKLPNGLHAVVPADESVGLHEGVIFVLKARMQNARHDLSTESKINQLHPYYLVYISEQGHVIYDYTQAKHLLDVARKACRGRDKPIPAVYEPFNTRTQDGKDMKHYSELLDATIASIQEVKADKDIDSLFTGIETTALKNDISGLNDFELIGFLIVSSEHA